MLCTVITITLNSGKKLQRALNSLLRQRNVQIEHIIVDGGSTDCTLSIAEKYKRDATYPVTIIRQKSRGIYAALNEGIAAASGEVIFTLHSDDYLYSDEIIAEAINLKMQKHVKIVYGDVVYTDGRRYSAAHFTPGKLLYGSAPPHPSMLIERSLFEKYGSYDESYLSAGDFDFIVRAVLRGGESTAYLPRTVQCMDSTGRSSTWCYRLRVNMQEKRRSLLSNGFPAPWPKLLLRYLF